MDSMQVRREVWTAHVETWHASGLTQAGYCQQHGLSVKRLAYWIKRRPTADRSPLTLVPVTVTQPAAAEALLLQHASGWQLALPADVNAAWLAGLLRGMV
jgi:hypothetical protein